MSTGMTTPDLATRLLDMCEKHGVDTGPYQKDDQGWFTIVTSTECNRHRRWIEETRVAAIHATRTEIESLAFRLEDKLEDLGYERQRINGKHEWCDMQAECDGFAWVPFAEHTDRIEAVILAAEKMGGE